MSGHIDGAQVERDVLAKLKSFQLQTVDHIFGRMYADVDPSRRYLCADEVGLGKTLVARGLIAKAINRLQQEGVDRIDVIYICSNAEIAAQNIRRLNVTGKDDFALATRITLLPRQLHRLTSNDVNFVSFTPGTSFAMSSREGRSEERAVLFRLLEHALQRNLETPGYFRALMAWKREDRFIDEVRTTQGVGDGDKALDRGLADAFARELHRRPDLLARLRITADRLEVEGVADDWNARMDLIRDLRITLARSCVEALEPDLVILDEFQRFKELLDEPDSNDPDDIRWLAHHLFEQKDVRTLLLSATPYKMYTLKDEQDDNHYDDFLRTTRFLMNDAATTRAFTEDVRSFRRALIDVSSVDDPHLLKRKRTVEQALQRVMVRTERLAVDPKRSGMLVDRLMPGLALTSGDVRAYAAADAIFRELRAGEATDFWKSAPYLLSFMGTYKIKHELKQIRDRGEPHPVAGLIGDGASLPADVVTAYGALDAGTPRLRGLLADTVERGTWQLLWVPPSLPYYTGRGAYADPELARTTKRLIFSSWNLVPDAISVVLSYEAERRMAKSRSADAVNTPAERERLRPLLVFRRTDDRAASMSTFSLLYPSIRLAESVDPLAIARTLGAPGRPVDYEQVLEVAAATVARLLDPMTRRARADGAEDRRWYWAAPLLIDRAGKATKDASLAWLSASGAVKNPGDADEADDAGNWALHLQAAQDVLAHGLAGLGRVPDDLARATAILALGAPGNVALRSVSRVRARVLGERRVADFGVPQARDAAIRIAWGFRTLYNLPEVVALLRGSADVDDWYWRRVAEEGAHGNLQAVMDEYVHVLPEWIGLLDKDVGQLCARVADTVSDAVSVRTVEYIPDRVWAEDGRVHIEDQRMRVRYALRLGRDVADGPKVMQRSKSVRGAFNSPFWPFVLTSTSVGQEGLDFHQYCHAIVHWNLPANPVDLEQREGRVHRFKGHAIRKNVAQKHAAAAFGTKVADPWTAMFDAAVAAVGPDKAAKDIRPFWVYPGDAAIERYTPNLPLSQEIPRLRQLKKSLAVYRLVMGQVRQDDLLAALGDRFTEEQLKDLAQKLRVDLSPKGR